MKRIALILAGGNGSRMGSEIPKQFLPLKGKPILMYTLDAFQNICDEVILVLPESQINYWGELCVTHGFKNPHKMAIGGITRFQSVVNGLKLVPGNSLVAIHDAVRPLVSENIILRSFEVAGEKKSAVTCMPLKDSIRTASGNVDRNKYMIVQTPQTFQSESIKDAYTFFEHIDPEGADFTDDASVFEKAAYPVNIIEGSYRNIKITTPEDLLIAEALLAVGS